MTLSVGCRAPSVSDLVSRLAENMSSSIKDDAVRRYTDEELLTGDIDSFSNGQLTRDSKQKAHRLVLESLSNMLGDDDWWDEFFGNTDSENCPITSCQIFEAGDCGNDPLTASSNFEI